MIAYSLTRLYRGTQAERTGNAGWTHGDAFHETDTGRLLIYELSAWRSITAPTTNPVATKSANYTLTANDGLVVFTATATATLPAATGSGQTFRIANESASGTLTIDGNGTDTIKGELTQTLSIGEDLIITDYATGKWA